MLDGTSPVISLAEFDTNWLEPSEYACDFNAWRNIVAYSEEQNVAYYAYVSDTNTIEVGKIRNNILDLLSNIGASARRIVESRTITTSSFAGGAAANGEYHYYTLISGGDGYIWGFEHAGNKNGNSSGSATVNWVKISMSNWSVQEGQWTIAERLYNFGIVQRRADLYTYGKYAIIHNGYLYCVRYNKTAIIKINLDNPADCVAIDDPDGNVPLATSQSNRYGFTQFNVVGDVVYYPGAYILGGVAYPVKTANADSSSISIADTVPKAVKNAGAPGLKIGPYLIAYMSYKSSSSNAVSIYRNVFLMTPYLATINNLETPVTKTADKTMKITYILREE